MSTTNRLIILIAHCELLIEELENLKKLKTPNGDNLFRGSLKKSVKKTVDELDIFLKPYIKATNNEEEEAQLQFLDVATALREVYEQCVKQLSQ